MSTTITVTGFQSAITAGGPSDPFSGVTLTDSSPSTTHEFVVQAQNGHVSGNPQNLGGLTLVTTIGDPNAPGAAAGYVLQGTAAQLATFLSSQFVVTFDSPSTSFTTSLTTEPPGSYPFGGATSATFTGSGTSGTSIGNTTTACYLRGTLIATPSGEVAIEDLRIGDMVSLADGSAQPIKWIATRSYRRAMTEVQPVCIRAGAIADNVPSRDLFVSPLHAMLVDGVLVPAVALVNGLSIVKCVDFSTVDYVHVELDSHAAIVANGAASESYADCGNRWMFHNAEEFAALYPNDASEAWAFCAPRVEAGAEVAAIHARLAVRATTLDNVKTPDHRLFVLADGLAVMPEVGADGRSTFRIPATPSDLRIVSRRAVPAQLGLSDDTRSVGIALRTITLRSGATTIAINAGETMLTDGFHAAEGGHRWTSGDAVLPSEILASLSGPVSLEIDADSLAFYPAEVSALAA